MSPLQKMKLLLNIDSTITTKDTLLQYLYDLAVKDYTDLTRQSTTTGAEDLIVRMAIVRYNLLGEEGLAAQSVSGVSETIEGYGADLLNAIYAHRRLKVV